MRKVLTRSAAALAVATLCSGAASALDLSTAGYVTYGDTQSYALALLNYQAVGGNNPGDPYYVNSTPGAIKNLVVVATGATGTDVTTNFAGMDNAYATPSGKSGSNFFSTTTGSLYLPNTNGLTIQNNLSTTWDSSVSAMLGFLNGDTMTFFFNNNQINSKDTALQSLAAYAQAWITAPDGSLYGQVFEFTNRNKPYDVVPNGGGIPSSTDPNAAFAYSSGITTPPTSPIAGDNTHTDYVLSGGQLCVDSLGNFVDCNSNPKPFLSVNNNLGANQAAYALIVPELNAELATLVGVANEDQYTLHLAVWLGCDPSIPADQVDTVCNSQPWGRSLNNGYEQIFIAGLNQVIQVPEPGTLLLLGLALAGLGYTTYRTGRRVRR